MCNLYRLHKPGAELAKMFCVPLAAGNVGGEIYPGQPGWVIGQHHMQSMHWGFPLSLRGKSGQRLKPKPVNNRRADKLDLPIWRDSFLHRRCLVPMTGFAEAEGIKGHKTRTWLSLPHEPIFACAGIWRISDEWGPVFSVVVTEASDQVRHVHDRMPVILTPEKYRAWLTGRPEAAATLCRPYLDDMVIERTDQPWTAHYV